jgi:putative membrane protein
MSRLLSWFLILLFVSIGVVLGVLNPSLVPINLFLYQGEWPLGVLLILFMLIGLVIGSGLITLKIMGLRWQLKSKDRKYQKALNEIIHLKNTLKTDQREQIEEVYQNPSQPRIPSK